MNTKEDLIHWWLAQDPLTKNEKDLLYLPRNNIQKFGTTKELDILADKYYKRMPFSNLSADKYKITFADTATEMIDEIFKQNVDDETLVIYSNVEHPSVFNNVKKCKNILELDYEKEIFTLNLTRIKNVLHKYKKFFVYIIGTVVSSGEITPQAFYLQIKQLLEENEKKLTLIIDDVHGMFFVPRDYSIFDYIIYTAHACINQYDMGILISKTGNIGQRIINDGSDYLKMLDVILKRKTKIYQFYLVMEQYFEEYLANSNFELLARNTPHLFSIKTSQLRYVKKINDKLDTYEIRLESDKQTINYLLFRNARFIKKPELLLPGLKELEKYLPLLIIDQ